MKILYAADNRYGANIQLKRFLDNCSRHEIRIAAYLLNSQCLPYIDWTLNALTPSKREGKYLEHLFCHPVPLMDAKWAEVLLEEVAEWCPDLIISDAEPILAHVAKTLDIRLWYCSPLHLLDGVEWARNELKYKSIYFDALKKIIELPKADLKLVYSPFGDVSMRPILKPGYEWCRPYTEICKLCYYSRKKTKGFNYIKKRLKNYVLTTGDTNSFSDAFYAEKKICVSPSAKDPEALLNGFLCEFFHIGSNLGEIETSLDYAIEQFSRFLAKDKSNYLSIQNWPRLHERIECII